MVGLPWQAQAQSVKKHIVFQHLARDLPDRLSFGEVTSRLTTYLQQLRRGVLLGRKSGTHPWSLYTEAAKSPTVQALLE